MQLPEDFLALIFDLSILIYFWQNLMPALKDNDVTVT